MRKQILVLLTLTSTLLAKPQWVEYGLGFNSGITGSGLHGSHDRYYSDSFGSTLELRLFDLKPDEMLSRSPYNYELTTSGGISLVMLTAEAGVRYFPFAGKIANNFSPFATVQLGPNFILDGQEEGKFFDRWQNAEVHTAMAGFIGAGVSFYISYKTVFVLSAGYDFLRLPQQIDGSDNYSGLLIKFTLSKRK